MTTLNFPSLAPSSREYVPGNWAVKTYNSISGVEIRMRYGNKRYNARLSLEYQNIPDTSADDFLAHYDQQFGTYKAFTLPGTVADGVTAGWTGSTYIPNQTTMKYRYSGPPSISSVRPGVSTVSIELTGVI